MKMTVKFDDYGAAYIEAPDGSWTRAYDLDHLWDDRYAELKKLGWRKSEIAQAMPAEIAAALNKRAVS
jgi:hypothetical protein